MIGSKIDGSRDALRNGRLGILVNPTDSAELRAAILQTLAAKDQGANERRNGVEYFSVDRFRQRVFEIIDTITTAPSLDKMDGSSTGSREVAESMPANRDGQRRTTGPQDYQRLRAKS